MSYTSYAFSSHIPEIWTIDFWKTKKLPHFGIPLRGFSNDFVKYVIPNCKTCMTSEQVMQKQIDLELIRRSVEECLDVIIVNHQ